MMVTWWIVAILHSVNVKKGMKSIKVVNGSKQIPFFFQSENGQSMQ